MSEFPNKLTQFSSENQPLNPGRKPGKTFKTILDELLDRAVKNDKVLSANEILEMYPDKNLTYREAMMVRMIAQAVVSPESKSAQRIMDRVDGLPKQTIEQTITSTESKIVISKDGEEINLKVQTPDSEKDKEQSASNELPT